MEVGSENRRRRGATLEAALLEAAWEEITERGYADFTVDAVADRARTSKAVLYRRWPGRQELARAAIERAIVRDPLPLPSTGNLRDDVLALLRLTNERRVGLGLQLVAHLSDLHRATGTSIADLRDAVSAGQESAMGQIVASAVERGEVDAAALTDRVVRLPTDLFRLELLMTSGPVDDADIVEIVDQVFLPLVRG